MEISQSILCISFRNDKYIPNVISTEQSDEKSNTNPSSVSHSFLIRFPVKQGMTIHSNRIVENPYRPTTHFRLRSMTVAQQPH